MSNVEMLTPTKDALEQQTAIMLFMDDVRRSSNNNDLRSGLATVYGSYLSIIDSSNNVVLALTIENGFTVATYGDPVSCGVTSERLELIGMPPFMVDETDLVCGEDGEWVYPDN